MVGRIATFLSSFVTLGIAYSFGAFFTEMSAELEANRAAASVNALTKVRRQASWAACVSVGCVKVD